jgi:hypothetical protein
MEKQLLATIVVFLFCVLYTVAIAAQNKRATGDGKSADANVLVETETRTQVQNLGFGRRIDVKLKDGSKATGRITGFSADRFVVTSTKGVAMPIAYTDVSRIAKQKEKLGIFHKPWVGIMFTLAGVGTVIVLAIALFD